jgi:hypothetical protein
MDRKEARNLLERRKRLPKWATLEQRLLAYVEKGERECDCWYWVGSVNKAGYGQLTYKGVHYAAHRLAYELWKGPIVERDVCHTCDCRTCVNPDHLVNESRNWNMKDAVKKGRLMPYGGPHVGNRKGLSGAKPGALKGRPRDAYGRLIGKDGVVRPPRPRDEHGRFVPKDGRELGERKRDALGKFVGKADVGKKEPPGVCCTPEGFTDL